MGLSRGRAVQTKGTSGARVLVERAELVRGWGGGKHPGPEVSPKPRYKFHPQHLYCVWPEADPRAYLSHTLPIKWGEQEVYFIVIL